MRGQAWLVVTREDTPGTLMFQLRPEAGEDVSAGGEHKGPLGKQTGGWRRAVVRPAVPRRPTAVMQLWALS